jgi:hypothetical protein
VRPTRTLAAIASIVLGVGIVAEPFVLSLWSDAPAGQRIVGRFDTTLSTQGLNALVSNFNTVGAMADQLFTQMVPALHVDMSQHPAIAHAEKEIPAAVALVAPVNKQLVAVHGDFEAVRSLPGLFGLPLKSIPWLLVGLGSALIALGGVALIRPGIWTSAAIAVAGVAMIVATLALSLPSKADAAVRVNDVGKVALSPVAAKAAIDTTRTIDALVSDVQTSYASEATRYPAVERGLEGWPSIRPGAYALAAVQSASLADRERLDNIPFRAFPWLLIGPGITLIALGGAAVAQHRATTTRRAWAHRLGRIS